MCISNQRGQTSTSGMSQMKALFSLALAVCILAASTAQAARVAVTTNGNVASVYLKAAKGAENGGDLNGDFDTLDFLFNSSTGVEMTNITSGNNAGVPRPAGDPFTYRNRVLEGDPLDGGLGWNVLAPNPAITPTEMQWTGGPLGGTIATGDAAGPGLFLANLQFGGPANKASGAGRVQLISAGNIVATIPIIIPEPASFGILGVAMMGLAGLRRRLA
jgi:hypothetical protein